MPPERMGYPMEPEGMKSWVAKDDLYYTPGRRILGKDCLYILFQNLEQDDPPPSGS